MRSFCSLFTVFALAVPALAQPVASNAPTAASAPATTNPLNPTGEQFSTTPSIDFSASAPAYRAA